MEEKKKFHSEKFDRQLAGQRRESRGPTQLLHWGVEWKEALFQELVHHLVVLCLNLRDHVTRDQTHSVPDLCPVEAVCVFIPKDLVEQKGVSYRAGTRRIRLQVLDEK